MVGGCYNLCLYLLRPPSLIMILRHEVKDTEYSYVTEVIIADNEVTVQPRSAEIMTAQCHVL